MIYSLWQYEAHVYDQALYAFSGNQGTLTLIYKATQAFDPVSINKCELYF